MLWFFVIFLVFSVFAQSQYENIVQYLLSIRRDLSMEPNYNETFFSSLQNYDINASEITEDKYPWIARLVHSRTLTYPYICTAVCVEDRIFMTAARCLYSLKVSYTTIIYKQTQFSVKAFVVPSNKSKQAFDDIGFVVVNGEDFIGQWAAASLFDTANRTDDNFNWFADLNLPEENWDHVAVGYANSKGLNDLYLLQDHQYKLKELEVVVNINVCPEILIYNKLITGFHVPCYHSCSVQQFKNKALICGNYLGVMGAAVFNTKTKKVLGVATWGTIYTAYELPVGFSVPNSKNFFEDLTCARRIKLDTGSLVINGYYQALCEE